MKKERIAEIKKMIKAAKALQKSIEGYTGGLGSRDIMVAELDCIIEHLEQARND